MLKSALWLPKFTPQMLILVNILRKNLIFSFQFYGVQNCGKIPFLGINRKLRYYFVDSAQGHFQMATESGIITLAKPLDRETRDSYNISVKAVDQGSPQMSSTISLLVLVLDVNDNPPEFGSRLILSV